MFTRNRVDTTRAEQSGGISPTVHCVLAVFYFKGTSTHRHQPVSRGINISGVDFWHAVEFSRNGRFLCTHPLGLSSGLFPSVLRLRLYQILSVLIFSGPLGTESLSAGPFDIHYVNRLPWQLIIEFREFEFRHADTPNLPPLRGSRR